MANSFFQKLILVILAGAATAGLYEFYRVFVAGSMDARVDRSLRIEERARR